MKKKQMIILIFIITSLHVAGNLNAQPIPYQKKTAQLMTTWGEDLDENQAIFNAYPRPILERDNWFNLNGIWELAKHDNLENFGRYNPNEIYSRQILVPFPIESALSGIMDGDYAFMYKTYVYRRVFEVDKKHSDKRIILNFGAVDWESYVFVNGVQLAHHVGGYDPFSIDITQALKPDGPQELVVQIYDPTKGGNPRGKQDPYPGGIWYTPSSGIWQTVWYEAVNPVHITDIEMQPDVDKNAIKLKVDLSVKDDEKIEIEILDGETIVKTANIPVGKETAVYIDNPKLWSPDSPFLYGLKFKIKKNGETVDEASSYFGMRKISLGKLRNKPYMYLNNQPIFHYGTLDQGFWPDGLHTPPSYEALLFDLEKTKELGMNMIRKHIKVEPTRWFYYCDSIGLMVWQDIPTPAGLLPIRVVGDGSDEAVKENFLRETEAIVKSLKNYTSIVMWVPFNEAWGQFSNSYEPTKGDPSHTYHAVELIKSLDDSRLINPASGWTTYEMGDIIDKHNYSEPELHPNPYNERASVCGETGGYGLTIDGHVWASANSPYTNIDSPEALAEKFKIFNSRAYALTAEGLNGIVYTQFSDIEDEVNGFFTYDRKVDKLALNDSVAGKVLKEGIQWLKTNAVKPLLKTANQGGEIWKYLTGDRNLTNPGNGWNSRLDFDDSSWSTGYSSFGNKGTTQWTSLSIFLRKIVELPDLSNEEKNSIKFSFFHDEDFEFYINGVLAARGWGYLNGFKDFVLSEQAKNAINWGGQNLFAIHVIQTSGGQHIDMGVHSDKIIIPLNYDPERNKTPEWIEISALNAFKAIKNNLSGYYKLTADIDLSVDANYEPIGSEDEPFTGILHGNGHHIIGPIINKTKQNNVALFGFAEDATITDLQISNIAVSGKDNVGALIGRGRGLTIERVVIDNPKISGSMHSGGFIGSTFGGRRATKITDCYIVNGIITSTDSQAGGIIGVASDTRIENSYFTGNIRVNQINAHADGSGIISRIEDGMNSLRGVVSLAETIQSGSANEFISFGTNGVQLNEFSCCFARDDMILTDLVNPNRIDQFARTPDYQKLPLDLFKTEALYQSMGWDLKKTWVMPKKGGFPVLKHATTESDTFVMKHASKENNLKVFHTNNTLVFQVKLPSTISLHNTSGTLIDYFGINGVAFRTLEQGIYIIKSVCNDEIEVLKIVI